MFAVIGIVIVFGAIAAGYIMEHGNFRVLMQPAELVIIFGAAVGTLVIANPPATLIKIGKGLAGVFSGSKFTKALYLESQWYSNWDLSTDRANSARRLMEAHGIRRDQVAQLRGFADHQLRHPEDPEHPSNRRISVIVQYLTPPAEAAKAPAQPAKTAGEAHKAPGEPAKALAQPSKAPAH